MLTHFFQKEYIVVIKTFSNLLYRLFSDFCTILFLLSAVYLQWAEYPPQVPAQTSSTSCSEFILPFLVSDHVSYFVYACDVMYSSLQKICILAAVNKSRTEYTNLLNVITEQTFSTTCSEFILPFLVSDHVSYFVYACDVMYSSLQQICILAAVNKSRTEYTNLLTVITAQTFSTYCSEFILPLLVSDHVSYFVFLHLM